MKTYLYLVTLATFYTTNAFSQAPDTSSTRIVPVDKEFTTVQVEAKFPGGADGWQLYLEKNLKVRTPVKHHAPAGAYKVELSFIVLSDGTVTEVEVLKDPGYGCAEEAVRVLKKSPSWIPATQNGKAVNYRQKQSITFVVS